MDNHVYAAGAGLVSRYGNTLDEFWNALILDMSKGQEQGRDIVNDSDYKEDYEGYFLNLCITGITRALEDGDVPIRKETGCVIVGTGMGISDLFLSGIPEPDYLTGWKKKLEARLYESMGRKPPHIIIIGNACCAGAQAIAYGYDLIRSGKYEYVTAGGVEAYSLIAAAGFKRLNCLDRKGCRPFDRDRQGIGIGDGAAFLALTKDRSFQKYGEILGQAVTNDAYHIVSPEPEGKSAGKAIQRCLGQSGTKICEVDAVVAHGTGTIRNDKVEAQVISSLFGDISVTAPKGRIGHTGGASGAFGVLTALGMLHYQVVPPVANLINPDPSLAVSVVRDSIQKKKISKVLVNCFAFGGTNTVILCGKPPEEKSLIKKMIKISQAEYRQSAFQPPDSRTMDEFTKKVLYTAEKLLEGLSDDRDPYGTGTAVSTSTGGYAFLAEIGERIREEGYKGINPSTFPNSMLSTALSQLAVYCKAQGPSCVFCEQAGIGRDAHEYCINQIESCNCKAMILICVDEKRDMTGYYYKKG